jgi:hypothetical protein
VGSHLDLRKPGGNPFRLVVVQVEAGRSFTLERVLPGARISSFHCLEEAPLGVRITQRVEAKGWAAWVVAWILGRGWRASLPGTLRGLARQVAEDVSK